MSGSANRQGHVDVVLPNIEGVRRRAYAIADELGDILAEQIAATLGKTPAQLAADDEGNDNIAAQLSRNDSAAQAFAATACAQLIALETLATLCRRHVLGVFAEHGDHPLWVLIRRESDALLAWHEAGFATPPTAEDGRDDDTVD
jgi:hypothetical protein